MHTRVLRDFRRAGLRGQKRLCYTNLASLRGRRRGIKPADREPLM